MGNKCDCYRIESKRKYTYNPINRELDRHDITVGVCWETKEIDECRCEGDRTKCDFYPEVREKALSEQENNITKNSDDCLIVTYDYCHSDVPTLCIARREKNGIRVLNTIQGNEAFGMYFYLTGNAELKEKQGKWKLNKDGSGTCDQCGITQKNVWDYDNYQNYCGHCGVKMSI